MVAVIPKCYEFATILVCASDWLLLHSNMVEAYGYHSI